MKSLTRTALLTLSLVMVDSLVLSPIAQADDLMVAGQYAPTKASRASNAVFQLRLDPATKSKRAGRGFSNSSDIALTPLSSQEIQGFNQPATELKQELIGIGRDLPATSTVTWQWYAVAGGKAAQLVIQSPEAQRLRLQLTLAKLPAGVEIRVFNPQQPSSGYGPFTPSDFAQQPKDAQGNNVWWTPTLEGDAIGLEVFVPQDVSVQALTIQIPRLSHLALNPATNESQADVFKADTSCMSDLACNTAEWQDRGKATAHYIFTTPDGKSMRCSGTLLMDTVADFKPYFLTANHCISVPETAATVETYWNYANSICGSNDAAAKQAIRHGAQLLATNNQVDSSLLLLNESLPNDVLYSGWAMGDMQPEQEVVGVQHTINDAGVMLPKTISWGNFINYGFFNNRTGQHVAYANGPYMYLHWSKGFTTPGSSGSGLWTKFNGTSFLVGSLKGGTSSCANPTGYDYYARFNQVFPLFQQWLAPGYTNPLNL